MTPAATGPEIVVAVVARAVIEMADLKIDEDLAGQTAWPQQRNRPAPLVAPDARSFANPDHARPTRLAPSVGEHPCPVGFPALFALVPRARQNPRPHDFSPGFAVELFADASLDRHSLSAPRQVEFQMIAGGVLEILALCSKIFFGGDDAGVAEAELDLLKGGVALVRQYGEGPAQVVGRQFR